LTVISQTVTIAVIMKQYQPDSLFESQQAEAPAGGHIVRVAFASGVDREFDYFVPEGLWPVQPGQRIEAPFGRANKLQIGFCICSDVPPDEAFIAKSKNRRMKTITAVVDNQPLLNARLLELARWIAGYYVCPLGQVISAMVPAAVKKQAGIKKQRYVYLSIKPADFDDALSRLKGKKQKLIVDFLQSQNAFSSEAAIRLNAVLDRANCTKAPVESLAEKAVVKIAQRQVFSALPAVPPAFFKKVCKKITLNSDQEKALAHIETMLDAGCFAVTLLHGVTDSGKTELYIRAIRNCIENKKSAIVLLPEIALTAQTIQRFSSRFENIAVMHSGLTAAQRNVQWQKIKAGNADVVIGARSAVFAPLDNLALIVVDEEHEPSYKQDTVPRYHARDVAVKRAQVENAHCILGSATPSLESLANCRTKKYFTKLALTGRVMDLPGPQMKLVDMRYQPAAKDGINLISLPLAEQLTETLEKGLQAMLLLNRRGYSNFIYCPACRYTLHCKNCDVTLTFHKKKLPQAGRVRTILGRSLDYGYAVCHYCLAQTLVPEKCPLCGKGLAMIGLGSQRLEEQLKKQFPHARISRIDSDSMTGKNYYRILQDFSDGKIDILAGTQMLAKGLHFPNVTLVGIISADTSLLLPDFRANERTFQLICQVAGRAGRSAKKSIVFVQTFLPRQPAIRFALESDFDGFVTEELKHRKLCHLPPFWRISAVTMRDRSYEKLEAAAGQIRQRIDGIVKRGGLKAIVRGPVPPPISRLQRFHRLQIIIQAPEPAIIQRLFAEFRSLGPLRPAVRTAVDIDPVNLL